MSAHHHVPVRAVLQRALDGQVHVAGERVGGFTGLGLVVLLGITHTDSSAIARRLARRIWTLRIFEPADPSAQDGPREVSAADLRAPLLVISQFTLYAQTSKGRRPTWDLAVPGHIAEPLVDCVVDDLRSLGAEVSTGVFGATMAVSLVNVGPMTILLDVDD